MWGLLEPQSIAFVCHIQELHHGIRKQTQVILNALFISIENLL